MCHSFELQLPSSHSKKDASLGFHSLLFHDRRQECGLLLALVNAKINCRVHTLELCARVYKRNQSNSETLCVCVCVCVSVCVLFY